MNLVELFEGSEDVVEFPAGSVLFAEREPGDFMYVILDGEVELSLRGEPIGSELTGGIVGEMALINATIRSATAKAMSAVTAARLNRESFKSTIQREPEFGLHVMAVLANRLRVAHHF